MPDIPQPNISLCGPSRNFSTYPSVSPKDILDYFEDKEEIQVDTETYGLDPHTKDIITLQLGDRDRQFVIDVRSVNILLFKDLIENRLAYLQNAKFDYKMLLKKGIVLTKVYDTMLAEAVIFNGFPDRKLALAAMCKEYLGVEMEKETRGTFTSLAGDPLMNKQIRYAGTDVVYLQDIAKYQQWYIRRYDLQYAVDVENQASLPLADIEYNGMYLNEKRWMTLYNRNLTEILALENEIDRYLVDKNIVQPKYLGNDLFGTQTRVTDINYGSSMQMKQILKKLDIHVTSTDEPTLTKLKDNRFVSYLLEHRSLNKKISTYGKRFLGYINESTGRVHTNFWQVKNTFRLGSGSKSQNAPNVQNIPASNEYRNCFEPRKEFSWLSIDYSSQELRLMADFSGETEFIDALNEGKDLHCFAYNKMTGENITKEDKVKRTAAKTINFGKPYGMSPYKLSDRLGIPLEEAEEKFKQYAKAFPKLNKWLDQQAKFGQNNGYIVLNDVHKGRRWFPEYKEVQSNPHMGWNEIQKKLGVVRRASMNTPIQGSGAIIVKEAMIKIREWLIKQGYWQTKVFMICQVHDQIDFEVEDAYIDVVKENCERIMIEVGIKYVTHVKMDVDSTVTKMWQK
jgi:DNA polymerase-1